jgi:NADH-quinone oxidoreductase subunit L
LALAIVAAVVRWGVPEPRWATGWLGLERATHVLVVGPTMSLAHALARFDDQIVDKAVMTTATGVLGIAGRAARIDVGGIDGAVEGIAAAIRRLGELARRPQTGLLHRYYLAGVGVLVAVVLLLATVR